MLGARKIMPARLNLQVSKARGSVMATKKNRAAPPIAGGALPATDVGCPDTSRLQHVLLHFGSPWSPTVRGLHFGPSSPTVRGVPRAGKPVLPAGEPPADFPAHCFPMSAQILKSGGPDTEKCRIPKKWLLNVHRCAKGARNLRRLPWPATNPRRAQELRAGGTRGQPFR